jgi:aminoglycoside phosphotransferase (APT) family kinase protein
MAGLDKDYVLYLNDIRKGISEIIKPELQSAKAKNIAFSIDGLIAFIVQEATEGRASFRDFKNEAIDALKPLLEQHAARAEIFAAAQALDADPTAEALESFRRAIRPLVAEVPGGGDGAGIRRRLALAEQRSNLILFEGSRGVTRSSPPRTANEEDDARQNLESRVARRLQDYLAGRFPEEAPKIVSVSALAGGRTKATLLVEVEGVASLPRSVVLRLDGAAQLTTSKTSDEYELLKVVAAAGDVPVPTPYLVEDDPAHLGGTFMLMKHVPGASVGDFFPEVHAPTEGRAEIADQLARAMARIHNVDLESLRSTKLVFNPNLREAIEQFIDQASRQLDTAGGPVRTNTTIAAKWLREHVEDGITPLTLVHNDLGLHNTMIDGTKLTAIIDWELALIQSPARDVAKTMHLAAFLWTKEDFIRAYLDAGGPSFACDPKAVNYYRVLNGLNITARTAYARQLVRDRKTSDLVTINAATDCYVRAGRLLDQALVEVL